MRAGGVSKLLTHSVGLLRTPDHFGRTCELWTLVTGRACSAAADLLTAGDYIGAYQHSLILFHGVRQLVDEVTAEDAQTLEKALTLENKSSTVRLATAMFPRILWNYDRLKGEFQRVRDSIKDLQGYEPVVGHSTVDVVAFAYALSQNLQGSYDTMVLDCLAATMRRASIVSQHRNATGERLLSSRLLNAIRRSAKAHRIDPEGEASLRNQLALLEALLADRIALKPGWDLISEDFRRLEQDFFELQAVADGAVMELFFDRLAYAAQPFMSRKDWSFFDRGRNLDNARVSSRMERILDAAYSRLEPLWSFTVALSSQLNLEENPMAPADAWWLGLIDEVVGTPLARRNIAKSVKARLMSQMFVSDLEGFYK